MRLPRPAARMMDAVLFSLSIMMGKIGKSGD